MSGPWEDYSASSAAPWESYAAAQEQPADASRSEPRGEGFWGATAQAAKQSAQQAVSGETTRIGRQIQDALMRMGIGPGISAGVATAADTPEMIGRGILSALGIFPGSLVTGAGNVAGETAQDVSIGLGASPDVSAGIGAGANALTQVFGPAALARGMNAGSNILRRARTPESLAVENLGKQFDVPLSAGQITGNPGISQLEAIPARFPIGSKSISNFARKQTEAAQGAASKIGEKLSPTQFENVSEAGDLFKEGYQIAKDASRTAATKAYDAVAKAVPPTDLFETPNLLKAAQNVAEETKLSKGVIVSKGESLAGKIQSAVGTKPPEGIEGFGPDAVAQIMKQYNLANPERQMTFKGMELLRQDLREQIRTAVRAGKDQEVRRLGTLIDGLGEDIKATAAKYPEAAPLLDKADQLFRQEVAPYFTKGTFTRKLSDKDASLIVKTAIWGNRDHPEAIALVRDSLKSPEKFDAITRAWWDDLVSKSIDPKTQVFSPQRFLTKYEQFTPQARQILLGENAGKADQLATLLQAMDRSKILGANPSETARGILGTGQALGGVRVVQNVATGRIGAAIKEGALLLTPAAIGKIVTSPRGIDLLMNGIQLPAANPASVATWTRLAALGNAMPKIEKNNILKSDLPIEEKINAALGDVTDTGRKAR